MPLTLFFCPQMDYRSLVHEKDQAIYSDIRVIVLDIRGFYVRSLDLYFPPKHLNHGKKWILNKIFEFFYKIEKLIFK